MLDPVDKVELEDVDIEIIAASLNMRIAAFEQMKYAADQLGCPNVVASWDRELEKIGFVQRVLGIK